MSLVPRSFFLDDFFDDFGKVKVQDMKCDIYEENNSYVVEMDVPGFNKDEIDIAKLTGTSDMKKVKDLKGNPLLLWVNSWSIGMTLDRNEGLILTEFGRN